jgi:hypothetical protein
MDKEKQNRPNRNDVSAVFDNTFTFYYVDKQNAGEAERGDSDELLNMARVLEGKAEGLRDLALKMKRQTVKNERLEIIRATDYRPDDDLGGVEPKKLGHTLTSFSERMLFNRLVHADKEEKALIDEEFFTRLR